MQKIADFIMSKKFLPVVLVLTIASFFIAFTTQGKNEGDDNPKSRYAKILRNVGILLEEGHYSPKKIDDAFSKDVFKKFLEDLDGDKTILLQSDIDKFKKFETVIDDEIHGAPIESFFAVNELYLKRQAEMPALYKKILAKPFDFSINELKSSTWNPSQYNVCGAFAEILNGNYDTLENRLRDFDKKMDNIPAYYEAALSNIKNPTL